MNYDRGGTGYRDIVPSTQYSTYILYSTVFTFSVCGVHVLPENISAVGEFPTRHIRQRTTVYETFNFLLQRRHLEASFVQSFPILSDGWMD
jgi:hypothetical protein